MKKIVQVESVYPEMRKKLSIIVRQMESYEEQRIIEIDEGNYYGLMKDHNFLN